MPRRYPALFQMFALAATSCFSDAGNPGDGSGEGTVGADEDRFDRSDGCHCGHGWGERRWRDYRRGTARMRAQSLQKWRLV